MNRDIFISFIGDHLKKPDRCSVLAADADLLCLMWEFEQQLQIQNLIIVIINNNHLSFFFSSVLPDETVRDWRWRLLAIVALSLAENKRLFHKSLCLPGLWCNSLDAVCSGVDSSLPASLASHAANSKCHPLLFEVFKAGRAHEM